MNDWSPIKYMGFYDVPLIFITRYRGETYLFDCPFDEKLEDDSESYKVYVRYLGEVPVARVRFDPSKRQAVDSAILDEMAARKAAAG
jgi:hypothetical protein